METQVYYSTMYILPVGVRRDVTLNRSSKEESVAFPSSVYEDEY